MIRMYARDEENFLFIIKTSSTLFDKNNSQYLNDPFRLLSYRYCVYEKNDEYNLEKSIKHFQKVRAGNIKFPIYVIKNNWIYAINNDSYIMEKTDRYIELMPFDNDEFVRKFKGIK